MPRPLNECRDCGATWYPRYRNLSRRCPDCGSRDVDIADEEFDGPRRPKTHPLAVLLAVITTPFLFIPCCGGCSPRGIPSPDVPPTAPQVVHQWKPAEPPPPVRQLKTDTAPPSPKKAAPRAGLPEGAIIVGEWLPADNQFMRSETGRKYYSGRVTIYRLKGELRYRQPFPDGSGPADHPLVEGKTPNGLTRYHRGDRSGVGVRGDDHMVIEADGSLVHWDNEGPISHLRYVKAKP